MIPNVTLKVGTENPSLIKELQEGLIKLKYNVGPDGADGDYGRNTAAAVAQFQMENGLTIDGSFGPECWAVLYELLGKATPNPTNTALSASTQTFNVNDAVKIKKGTTYTNGKKVPSYLQNILVYVKSINNNGVVVSLFKAGVALGEIAPEYLELVKSSGNTSTVIDAAGTTTANNPVVSNSSYTVDKLIQIAKNELGYHEKNSNNNLDDKTANSGSGNWTKYARDLANAGYYGGNKNGYAWCDVFTDWCFYTLCNKDRKKAEDMICQSGTQGGAGCANSASYYKQAGRWSNTPKVGAQIFFYYNGDINHTGIVIEVNGNNITTIEGNSSDQVSKRTYPINYGSIAGYGLPKYDEEVKIRKNVNISIIVTAQKLNIRQQPSTEANIIGIAIKNEILQIKAQEGVYGQLSSGGWIDLTYTKQI